MPIPKGSPLKVTSVVVNQDLWKKAKLRCPRHGDLTKVVNRLLEMFVNGEVKVIIQKQF